MTDIFRCFDCDFVGTATEASEHERPWAPQRGQHGYGRIRERIEYKLGAEPRPGKPGSLYDSDVYKTIFNLPRRTPQHSLCNKREDKHA